MVPLCLQPRLLHSRVVLIAHGFCLLNFAAARRARPVLRHGLKRDHTLHLVDMCSESQ